MLKRRGTSLAEVIVALTLGGLVLATATSSLLRQQRTTAVIVAGGSSTAQLRAATGLLPAQLGLLAPATADLVAGEARDTSLQLRVAIASGISCQAGSTPAIASGGDSLPSAGIATQPGAGDSLWWYVPDSARWLGRRVSDAWQSVAPCPASSGLAATSITNIRLEGPDSVPALAPVRVTRQERLALYRSGDGTWQLGLREWSDVTHAFVAPQPLAGPFQRLASDGGAATGFRYFDAAGVELHPERAANELSRVARIRFTAAAVPATQPGATPATMVRDSADVVLVVDPAR